MYWFFIKWRKMKKKLFVFFFILLVFHIGLIIPKAKFECSCSLLFPEAFSPCCNCSHCVSQRGGFLSACSCHESTEKHPGDFPSIKRAICFCGSSGTDFDLPGAKFPILPDKNLFPPPFLEIHPFFSTHTTLTSQVYLAPSEHPS